MAKLESTKTNENKTPPINTSNNGETINEAITKALKNDNLISKDEVKSLIKEFETQNNELIEILEKNKDKITLEGKTYLNSLFNVLKEETFESVSKSLAKIGRRYNVEELKKLRSLNLQGNPMDLNNSDKITPELIRKISKLPKLTNLDLSYNNISQEMGKEIGKLSNLTNLRLSGVKITSELFKEIGKLSNLTNLELINTDYTISNNDLKEIRKLPKLTVLTLNNVGISDNGVKEEVSKMGNLTKLDISCNDYLTYEGLKKLSELKNLNNLMISGPFDFKLLDYFKSELPDCKLIYLPTIVLKDQQKPEKKSNKYF